MPSFYQDDLFSELARKVDLRVVYDHGLTDDRRHLGWPEPTGKYTSCLLDARRKIQHAGSIARSELDRVHVLNGVWAEVSFMAAAYTLGRAGAKFAIYSECPDNTVRRSTLRRGTRAAIGRWVARRSSGLFAVSHFAKDYFAGAGFREKNIYPFGYFRASRATATAAQQGPLVYLGQLVHRKGVDLLLEAMAPLWAIFPRAELRVVGVGPERASIQAKIQADGVADRVILEDAWPATQIHEFLGGSSALILPSRWDGWGLVVNEALSAGVPVIVSDRCGAADVILDGINGYVFRSEDIDNLRACLRALLESNTTQMRRAALETSSGLTIPSVSDYFIECLEHMCGLRSDRPTPPWEETLSRLRRESSTPHGDPSIRRELSMGTHKRAL